MQVHVKMNRILEIEDEIMVYGCSAFILHKNILLVR
jgi:hypothetical protein